MSTGPAVQMPRHDRDGPALRCDQRWCRRKEWGLFRQEGPVGGLPRRHRLRVRPQASPITYEASSDINERIFITPMVLPYYWPRVDIVISLYLEGPMRDAGGG